MRYVGIAAYSGSPPQHLVVAAEEFLQNLSLCSNSEDIVIVVGGYWGLMKYIVDFALNLKFKVLILPPLEMEDVRFPKESIVVKTGTSFRVRSVFMVRTSDALVVLGGASGTMQEVITAYTEKVPVFVLGMSGLPSDKLRQLGPYVDERKLARIEFISDPGKLASEVCKEISKRS